MTRADLIAWRESMGWSKPQAAAALGMTYRGYQMLEAGDHALRTVHELACLELTRRASSAPVPGWLNPSEKGRCSIRD